MIDLDGLFGVGGSSTAVYQAFIASGTFTVPEDCTLVIHAIGGGGSGGYRSSLHAGGGGAGGYSTKKVRAKAGDVFTFTVGAGGLGQSTPAHGVKGGDTTVSGQGVSISAGGGSGGSALAVGGVATGGAGGIASGGDVNLSGGKGGDTSSSVASAGGGGGVRITHECTSLGGSVAGSAPAAGGGGGLGGDGQSRASGIGTGGGPDIFAPDPHGVLTTAVPIASPILGIFPRLGPLLATGTRGLGYGADGVSAGSPQNAAGPFGGGGGAYGNTGVGGNGRLGGGGGGSAASAGGNSGSGGSGLVVFGVLS